MQAALSRSVLQVVGGRATAQPFGAISSNSTQTLNAMLLHEGIVAPHDMVVALALHAQRRGRLADILLAKGLADETALYSALARHWGAGHADLANHAPDPRLLDRLGATRCLQLCLLPWRSAGQGTIIVTAQPEDLDAHRAELAAEFGPVLMAVAPARQIEAAILRVRGPQLARQAETRLSDAQSCRGYSARVLRAPLFAIAAALIVVGLLSPLLLISALTLAALLAMVSFNLLKLAAAVATELPAPTPAPPPHIARLPVVSAMVPLFKESHIASRLVKRLSKLDYPVDLLDILLVVEADDHLTRDALAGADLPRWMRVITVPHGAVQTKPRALNFALDHCRGSIIGVYDAEDAPEPDQIRKVVDRFYQRGADLACLQGVLDFFNPRTNWLSRCFTVEYACWFRLLLPGIERLGLPVPLGGTTLFFRRAALEELGGWDAHNVTEDADLGMRLARHGYRTEVINTVTEEEANCRALPWVKQRSRWIKGYMMTWAGHMRDPRLLLRQLGWWRFTGFQILMLGSIAHALLAPLLWSFWIVPFGFYHPVAEALPPAAFWTLCLTFFATEAFGIGLGILGLSKTRHNLNPLWVPTLYAYQPLATLAAYKAAWELLTKPFYWDKTSHGHFDL